MLKQGYNIKLDAVGKIDIRDNVFIGYGAIILPNVTLSSNAIVAAGAVVTNDVAEGDIVAGVPAWPIGRVEDLMKKLLAQTQRLPWADLINCREGGFDPAHRTPTRRLASVALLRQYTNFNCGAIGGLATTNF